MNTRFAFFTLGLTTALIALPAAAHDPALHKDDGKAGADCSQMKNMDMSKMDPNDPVMKAMHEKCMKNMQQMPMDHDKETQGMKDMKPADKQSDKSKPQNDMNGMKGGM